jgi:hypothetical protein
VGRPPDFDDRLAVSRARPTSSGVRASPVVAGRSIHTSVRDPGGRLDATVDVHPGTGRHGGEVDQVRNGNRWRVTAVDETTNRLAAERLTDPL